MWLWLEGQGIHRNPKTVLRVMKKYEVLILVFEDGHIEITYLFSDELGILGNPGESH